MNVLYSLWGKTFQPVFDKYELAPPYVFLKRMWTRMVIDAILVLCVGFWYLFTDKDLSHDWFMYSAFLFSGPISVAASCAAPVADTRRKHAMLSALTCLAIAFFSTVTLQSNPALLGVSLWVMLMFGIFQSRFHERREINWTAHEDVLAVLAGFVSLGAYLLIPTAPWLMVGLLVAVAGAQRIIIWGVLRTRPLLVEQHETVWPRLARKLAPMDFWASLVFYVALRNGIPPDALRRSLCKVDIDILLEYFDYNSVFQNPDSLLWHQRDLAQAITESMGKIDERTVVVFELCGSNTQQAVAMIRALRAGEVMPVDSMPLPDLGSAV